MVTPCSLDEVLQELAQDQNLTRIKKLLVYACTDIWESNPARLDEFDLHNLLESLLETAPTVEQLRLFLNGVVKTLNKQAEYTLVANAITNALRKAYPDYEPLPQEVSLQSHYRKIARELARDREQLGIKKLLFCASGNHWENNPAILDNIDFLNLVQHIHELAPTLEELKNVLYSIVKTLNRQSKYTPIANKIVVTFGTLYNELLPDGMDEPESIQITNLPQLPTFPSKLTTAPKFNPDSNPQVLEQIKRSFDWFDLRLELMKQTNPLRAKILIFSTLYDQFDQDDESWTAFKLQTLDDLLRDLFLNHLSLNDLQVKLENTAKALAEPDQYYQAAGAILRAAKPFYAAGLQQIQMPSQTQMVERSPHSTSTTQINSPPPLNSPPQPPIQGYPSTTPVAESSSPSDYLQSELNSPAIPSTILDGSLERQNSHQQAYEAFLTAVEDLFKD